MGGVILFDGTCAFCEGSVRFIAARDGGYFKFGPSQTAEARHLLAQHHVDGASARSIILIENDEVFLRSTAALRIAKRLDAPWRWASVLLWVPRPIRDAVYGVIAAVRHRLAGQSNACEVPPPEIRARLI